jgi:hypothetical protein
MYKRNGGIHFFKAGRINLTFSLSRKRADETLSLPLPAPRAVTALEFAIIGTVAIAFASTLILTYPGHAATKTHRYEIQAVDKDGALFIAGAGDTCREAHKNEVLPANLFAAACVKVSK